MKFHEWVDVERGDDSRTQFLRGFSKQCHVSVQTLQFVIRGGRMRLYDKAQAVSEATNGKVTVPELCE